MYEPFPAAAPPGIAELTSSSALPRRLAPEQVAGPTFHCGCATPYQRTGLTGGFSETQLQPNVFSVHFRGNGYTSRQRSSDLAMLRCAELAIQNGFPYFVIADSSQDTKTMMYNTGGSSHTYGTVNTFGNTSYGSFNTYHSGGTSVPISKPRSSYTIVCFKEKPEGNNMAFDAAFLANSLRQKYGIGAK